MTAAKGDDRATAPLPARQELWRWPELCAALDLPVVSGPDVAGISIDSRTLAPGELFIALAGNPGPRFQAAATSDRDGHDFLAAAAQRGAAGALVCDDKVSHAPPSQEFASALPLLRVADTIDGLWALGRAGRLRSTATVVAVTGSSGKTTLKTMLAQGLDAYSSAGSFNNHLGVPLTLARMPADASHAVVEIGTNHPGEIAPLTQLAAPHVAVVLNVLPAHVGNFPDMAALCAEKLSIATGLISAGVLVLPAELAATCSWPGKRLTFGSDAGDVRVTAADEFATIHFRGSAWQVAVPGGGAHRALSCAAAFAVAAAVGVPLDSFLASIGTTALPAGRGNRVIVNAITLYDDSYNANPVSMRYALEALAAQPGRHVALLGDMLELGEQESALHAGVADACDNIDVVVCTGARMKSLYERLPAARRGGYFPHPADLTAATFAAMLQPGDRVLVKGSKMIFWARRFVAELVETLQRAEKKARHEAGQAST